MPMKETHDVSELCFRNQIFCLCSNKLLFQNYQLRAFRFLSLQLRNLVMDLGFVISAGLDTFLCIPNCFQGGSAVIQIVCIEVFLFTKLGEQNSNLVGDIANCIVCRGFTPVRKLTCDGEALFSSGFVALDEVVLRLDELIELLAQLGLDRAAEGAEAEAMTSTRGRGRILVGTDRKSSIPVLDHMSAIGCREEAGFGSISTDV
jgi:hypothetical protein